MLHDIVVDELESHLSGTASRAFHEHLAGCPECRSEVAAIADLSRAMRALRSEPGAAPEPALGFYSRVANRIIDHQRREAWGLFSPGAAFFRRIAFASLLLLAGLGGFIASRESAYTPAMESVVSAPDAALIQHNLADDHAPSADRDRMFITLATYRQ